MGKEYEDFGEDEFLDNAANIVGNSKLCFTCIHFFPSGLGCKAFPNGIPIVYKTGRKQHTKPSKKYNQKNDLVWTYDENQTWIKRQWKIDRNTEIKVVKCGTNQDKAIRLCNKLKKQGWDVDIRSWDEFPQEFTVHASRKRKK